MILVVGLSPVWQRSLQFADLALGRVNRAQQVRETASGKGVNVVRVLGQLGAEARLLTVAGGQRGQLLRRSLTRKKVAASIVRVAAETRVCQTLLSSGGATELVEESGAITARELAQVWAMFRRQLWRAQALVLSGTVPKGIGEEFYARLTREAVQHGLPVLVDAQRQQLWNAVTERPLVVKVNREELLAVAGGQDLASAAGLLQERGAQWVVVSNGGGMVLVVDPAGQCVELAPPSIDALNPIGSGDAMLAGLTLGLSSGWPMLKAVGYGMAAGAANALRWEPGEVRLSDVRRLWRDLQR